MKTTFLFPASFRPLGWIVLILGLAIGIVLMAEDRLADKAIATVFAIWDSDLLAEQRVFVFTKNSILDEIAIVLVCVGGLFAGFARVRDEDEFIASVRYESLVWALYLYLGVLVFATLFFYGVAYWYFMIANIVLMLLFFVVRFHFKLHQLRKSVRDEE